MNVVRGSKKVVKRGSKTETRAWTNQSPRQTKAWDKRSSWMNEVREWAYTLGKMASLKHQGSWTNEVSWQIKSSNKWSPRTQTNKVSKQTRSLNKCGPPTNKFSQRTNTFMNCPVVRIVMVVPTLKWSCHVSTNSHEKQFHGNTPKRALCSFHLYVF